MALIACPECEGRVSDRAAACPHCGFPVSRSLDSKAVADEDKLMDVSPAMFGRNPFAHLLVFILSFLIIGLIFYFVEWMKCRATRLVITSRRTTLEEGWISKETSEVRHSDVRNIQVTQGAWDRMLGVGKLELSSSGQGDVEITVSGIPDPQGVADLIREQR